MVKIQPLSQTDPRWKNTKLGNDQTVTIGKYGCLLTCMTMVSNVFGADETPATLNSKMRAVNGFQGALIIPSLLPSAVPGMRHKKYQPCEDYPAPVDEIDATLAIGKPVIVKVDYSPSAGIQDHWIVLLDKKGNDYIIQDPYPYPAETKEVLLTQRYGFAGKPVNIIKEVLWLDSANAATNPKPTPKPIPTSGFVVYPTTEGIALRSQPVVLEETLIKRLGLETKLFVSEDVNAAKAKVGVQDQWIKAIDGQEGYEGYVAGWLLATAQAAPPTQPTQPAQPQQPPVVVTPTSPTTPTTPEPSVAFIVYAMSDGLALRSQPVVADNTLLKRLPLNAQFVSLEPLSQAFPKLGQVNQWLQVKDVEGDQGYVAAWYVSQFRQDVLGVKDQSTPPPTSATIPARLVVRAAEEGLALRSQPQVSDATLMRRYPLLSEFLVLDPVAQALPQIGQNNQWLKVRAIDGQEGYVAAWYVIKRPAVAA